MLYHALWCNIKLPTGRSEAFPEAIEAIRRVRKRLHPLRIMAVQRHRLCPERDSAAAEHWVLDPSPVGARGGDEPSRSAEEMGTW